MWAWPCLAMLVLGFLTEVGVVGYYRAVGSGHALRASLFCAFLVALGFAGTYLCVTTTWFLVLPAMAGHSAGTYWSVKRAVH